MISQKNFLGNPFVGLFCVTTDDLTFVPYSSSDEFVQLVRDVLGTDVVKASIYNSPLLGVFSVANSKGIVLPRIAYSEEEKLFSEYLDVCVLEGFTAIGNLVEVNDKKGIVSPAIQKDEVKMIQDSLKVDVTQKKVGGVDVPGSSLVVTNKGFLATPMVSRDEFLEFKEFLGLDGALTTVNYGNPMVGSGIIANFNGAIVGTLTTPYELGLIDEGLFLGR